MFLWGIPGFRQQNGDKVALTQTRTATFTSPWRLCCLGTWVARGSESHGEDKQNRAGRVLGRCQGQQATHLQRASSASARPRGRWQSCKRNGWDCGPEPHRAPQQGHPESSPSSVSSMDCALTAWTEDTAPPGPAPCSPLVGLTKRAVLSCAPWGNWGLKKEQLSCTLKPSPTAGWRYACIKRILTASKIRAKENTL